MFGVGLGMSRQKYSYLPEAHNDFIFAIIGEELGLLGTLAVLLAFAVLLYEAIQIMRQSSDLLGKLIVCGSITILITQAFLNITGVLGLFPLSGKPLPFLSYGGSSIMSSLMLAGLVVNVSLNSSLPETTHDVRRRDLKLAGDEDTGVGNARSRSASVQESSFRAAARTGSVQLGGTRSGGNRSGGTRDGGLSVIEGGINERERAKDRSQASRQGHGRSRSDNTSAAGSFTESRGSNGYTRLDKHEDASTRLRSGSNSPKVRGGTTNTGSAKGTRHNKRS